MRKSNIIFDLDGTITDSGEGIVNSIKHVLGVFNVPIPEQALLKSFIGPPLVEILPAILGTEDTNIIERALVVYRMHYSSKGLYENALYPGITETLEGLRQGSYKLYVATSKLRPFAERILRHFALRDYFNGVYGSEIDGTNSNKIDVIRVLLERERISARETLMIGDRQHDIESAKKNGVATLGVTYGYGSRDELMSAGADLICDSPGNIVASVELFSRS